jgi:hypothetical protein
MRHIKLFEDLSDTFNVGDFVKINNCKDYNNYHKVFSTAGIYGKKDSMKYGIKNCITGKLDYKIATDISLLSDEEIEEIEIVKTANMYNI